MRASRNVALAAVAASLVAAGVARALPIGFGINQGDLDYAETRNDHFYVYHDARVPTEGAMVLNALEAVRPVMERWFDEKRRRPLPVVMSAVTSGASFANIVTDAIELQTMGQADKSLVWHEYVHSTMYRRFDNIFGPPGNLLHVVWMPAWYIEGLAEALSVSVGSDATAGIERFQALTGQWPTYDRLHSLYTKAGFFERGYATAGALVSYTMRKGDPDKLAHLLSEFRGYTMPWWWLWTVVPYNGFLPLDAALRDQIGLGGEPLYDAYKKEAAAFWRSAYDAPFLYETPGRRRTFSTLGGLRSNGAKLLHLTRLDGELHEVAIRFDPKTGWATGWDARTRLSEEQLEGLARIVNPGLVAGVSYDPADDPARPGSIVNLSWRGPVTNGKARKARTQKIRRDALVFALYEAEKHVAWLEQEQAETRLCYAPKEPGAKKPAVTCPVTTTMPARLRPLGEETRRLADNRHGIVRRLWLRREVETLTGTRYEVVPFDLDTMRLGAALWSSDAQPLSLAVAGEDLWLLVGERNQRTLRRIDRTGACRAMVRLKDHVLDLHGFDDGSLALGLYGGDDRLLMRLSKDKLAGTPCVKEDSHVSPLLYAVRHEAPGHSVTLKEAFAAADLWKTAPTPLAEREARQLAAAPPLDQDRRTTGGAVRTASRAAWRGRPVLLFPWIGADDAMGSHYGVVSVPLMDHMQNETLRATFLYGSESRFPYQELLFTTTRWKPTVDVAAYRQQTYNGRYLRRSTGLYESGYLDEKGVRLEVDRRFALGDGSLTVAGGFKYAHLAPYMGPLQGIRRGFLAEPTLGLSTAHPIGTFTLSNYVSARVAPEWLNEDFEYNQLGGSSTLSHAVPLYWRTSRLSLGVEGSRTRGTKRRELMEVYRPLKTFIPGSGGGYNQNSFPIAGEAGGGLFSPVFGDTQGRAKANWTVPLVPEFDKLIWILYLERLDFTAFYNYGAAWNGESPRVGFDKLIRAHGYNLDLQLENKGVRFNLGIGTGQVIGRPFEAYVTTGFDALF